MQLPAATTKTACSHQQQQQKQRTTTSSKNKNSMMQSTAAAWCRQQQQCRWQQANTNAAHSSAPMLLTAAQRRAPTKAAWPCHSNNSMMPTIAMLQKNRTSQQKEEWQDAQWHCTQWLFLKPQWMLRHDAPCHKLYSMTLNMIKTLDPSAARRKTLQDNKWHSRMPQHDPHRGCTLRQKEECSLKMPKTKGQWQHWQQFNWNDAAKPLPHRLIVFFAKRLC